MTPEMKRTILENLASQRAVASANLRRIQLGRELRGLDPLEGDAVGAMESDIIRIDAAIAELEAEPKPGAIVVSKTRTREDGSEETVHYLCGDQRATREEALADLDWWLLLRAFGGEWSAVQLRLRDAGFGPGLAGVNALIAERRALYDALADLYLAYEMHGQRSPEQSAAMDRAHVVGLGCWLACPDNYDSLADPVGRKDGST